MPPAQTGLKLRGSPPEASVVVDGNAIGKTPIADVVTLKPGEHTLRVSRPGFTPFIDVIRVKSGAVTTIDYELVPISGVLKLTAKTDGGVGADASRVFLDDKYIGDAPVETEMTTGNHTLRVERGGFHPESFTVSAVAGQTVEREVLLRSLPADQNPYVRKPPPKQKWYQKWWVWTIVAGGVAVVATAVIVPVVLSRRDVCDGQDICVPVGTEQSPLLQIQF